MPAAILQQRNENLPALEHAVLQGTRWSSTTKQQCYDLTPGPSIVDDTICKIRHPIQSVTIISSLKKSEERDCCYLISMFKSAEYHSSTTVRFPHLFKPLYQNRLQPRCGEALRDLTKLRDPSRLLLCWSLQTQSPNRFENHRRCKTTVNFWGGGPFLGVSPQISQQGIIVMQLPVLLATSIDISCSGIMSNLGQNISYSVKAPTHTDSELPTLSTATVIPTGPEGYNMFQHRDQIQERIYRINMND